MELMWLIISIVLQFIIAILLHELGHLICGLLSGYRFNSFQVGFFYWYTNGKKVKFKFKLAVVAGQCLLLPPEDYKKFKFFWYNFGGSLFNLITALLLFICIQRISFSRVWQEFFWDLIVFSNFIAVLNLLPVKLLSNDGYNIWLCWKSKVARKGMYAMLYVQGMMTRGFRWRDFSPEIFEFEKEEIGNYLSEFLILGKIARLQDLKQNEIAIDLLKDLVTKNISSVTKTSIKLDLFQHYLLTENNIEKAEEMFHADEVQNFLKTHLPMNLRILASYYYLVLEDEKKGQEYLEKADKAIHNIEILGQKVMEIEELDILKNAIHQKTEFIKREPIQTKNSKKSIFKWVPTVLIVAIISGLLGALFSVISFYFF